MTVVIPVLNDAEMLWHCLAALAAQTRPPDQILVFEHNSTDTSAELASRSGAIVVSEPMTGIPAATARGVDEAPGDVLARIDADSRPGPDWLARLMRHFEQNPDLSAVTGTGRFYGSGRVVQSLGQHLYLGGYFLWMGLLLGHPPLYGSNFAIRATTWHAVRTGIHLHLPGVHDDLDLSFRLRPGMRVVLDRDLVMPVSARPFASVSATARRVRWGFRTIWINGREENLLARRARFVAARRARSRD